MAVPVPHLIGLALLLVGAALLADYLIRARRVRQKRLQRLRARLAQLNSEWPTLNTRGRQP